MVPQPLICVTDVEASSRWYQRLLGCRSDVVERLRCSIAAGEEQAVVSKNAILPRTARDPVVAITADDIVILGVAEDYIAARHAEDEIVPVFSIDQISRAIVSVCRAVAIVGTAREIRTTKRVVKLLHSSHADLCSSIIVVGKRLVISRPVDGDQAEHISVITQDEI